MTRSLRLPAATGLALLLLAAAPVQADSLCLKVTMNDQPAGAETELRLTARGQPSASATPRDGQVQFDGLASGRWTVQLTHPRTKVIRTPVTISGATSHLLDCGHADEWSGCQLKALPGGC